MTAVAVGTRVGAVRNAENGVVYLLGYGVFDGNHEPPFGPFGMPIERWKELGRMAYEGQEPPPLLIPRLTLDDGSVVWGAQCWWGPEQQVKEWIGDSKVVLVDLEGNPKTLQ